MNWIKLGGYFIIIVPTLLLGILLGFYLLQESLIFLAEKLPAHHRFVFSLPSEELSFKHPDGHVLNGLLFKAENSKGLVFYHHGNAGNIQDWGKLSPTFLSKGWDVLFYDYRGYGKSTGRIRRESSLHTDALFIRKEIDKRFDYDRLVYYGTSLGSGVASRLAVEVEPDAVILETPYYSFTDLITYLHPYLPANFLSKYKFRNARNLSNLDCPVLLIHGTRDEIIPYNSSERLLEICKIGTLVTVPNGLHNNLPDFPVYHAELKKFLNTL